MPVEPGTRLARYEIVSLIGSGGMGEVYRAHDAQLGRTVAIKVLRPGLVDREGARTRLVAEARAASALNHPNIVTVHDVGSAAGVDYIVMELVSGHTLASRLERGAIDPGQVLQWGIDMASALAAAHAHGIVHRDLKPVNVILSDDGRLKIVDFGIARLLDPDDGPDTATSTVEGTAERETIVRGTAPYMSPEQIAGERADARSDIFAAGAMLYEMASGHRAFQGPTAASAMAAVLASEPRPLRDVAPQAPRGLERIVERCLQKRRAARFQSAADLKFALEAVREDAGSALIRSPSSSVDPVGAADGPAGWRARFYRLAAAALAAGGAVALAALAFEPSAPPAAAPRVSRLGIAGPELAGIDLFDGDRLLAITPDGTRVVFVGNHSTQLFVRPLDALTPSELTPPSGGVRAPFISPDNQMVGYIELNFVLKVVSISGGSPVRVATLDGPSRGATWESPDAIIVATSNTDSGLQRFDVRTGAATVLTRPDPARGELDHVFPEMLPGGRAVLMTILPASGRVEDAQVAVLDLATQTTTPLVRGGYNARYMSSGHLVYVARGALHAAGFDLERLQTHGTPRRVLLVPGALASAHAVAQFDVSVSGALAYLDAGRSASRTLVWVDRDGRETPVEHSAGGQLGIPRLSPGGTRLAMSGDVERDIWVWDVRRTLEYSRRTFGPDVDSWPVWLSDERLVFGSLRGTGLANIYELAAGGKGEPEPLTEGVAGFVPLAAVPDGSAVLLAQPPSPAGNDGWNLRLLPLTPRAAGRPALHDLNELNTPDHERHGTISPDGRWIAYDSNNVGGRFEVFVRPFPDVHGGRWQISIAGGQQPAWSRTSTELFFLGPDRTMHSASIDTGAKDWTTVTRRALFTGDYVVNGVGNIVRHYDVSRDGRFLMLKEAAASPYVINQIVVVQNWAQEVARLLAE